MTLGHGVHVVGGSERHHKAQDHHRGCGSCPRQTSARRGRELWDDETVGDRCPRRDFGLPWRHCQTRPTIPIATLAWRNEFHTACRQLTGGTPRERTFTHPTPTAPPRPARPRHGHPPAASPASPARTPRGRRRSCLEAHGQPPPWWADPGRFAQQESNSARLLTLARPTRMWWATRNPSGTRPHACGNPSAPCPGRKAPPAARHAGASPT